MGRPSKAVLAREAQVSRVAQRTVQIKKDLEEAQAMINDCTDVGTLLKMQKAQEDKIKKMEAQHAADDERRAEEQARLEAEAHDSLVKSGLTWLLGKPKPKKTNMKECVELQRKNMEGFYELMQMAKAVRRTLGKIFQDFDANGDGSIDLQEFRAKLREPKERTPFLARLFLSMDDDQLKDEDRMQKHGTGELDMFEFFVGYYSLCTLPRGDYAIRQIWDLYDPRRTGTISMRTFKKMLRETMGATLPDYLARPDDVMPPAIERKLQELRQKERHEEEWTRMAPGDVCMRTDGDGDRHLAVVRDMNDVSIMVQDVYAIDNAMGWTQGQDHCFTYKMGKHQVGDRVTPPVPGVDLFDDALEQFMFISADTDDSGDISLKEFRHFVRRRVAKGEPSPYASFLTFQKKLRSIGGLGDQFWDARSLDLVVTLEKKGLWSAWEYYRHKVLRKALRRAPKKLGGEDDVPPPPKEKKKKTGLNVEPPPLPRKPRKRALKGEDLIDACLSSTQRWAADGAGMGPSAEELVREQAQRSVRDEQARKARLTIIVLRAKNLVKVTLGEGPRPDCFCTCEGDFEPLEGESPTKYETVDPTWKYEFPETRVPDRLRIDVWDRVGEEGRQSLGYGLIRRKRLWDVCRTKTRQVGLPIIGHLDDGRPCEGELWRAAGVSRSSSRERRCPGKRRRDPLYRCELRWEPRPHDPAEDAPLEGAWAPKTPQGSMGSLGDRPKTGRRAGMTAGIAGIEELDSDDSQYEELVAKLKLAEELEKGPPKPVERRAVEYKYTPLPAVTEAMVRRPPTQCVCGWSTELPSDMINHAGTRVATCDERSRDPMRVLDMLLLLRKLDPGLGDKEAHARLLSRASAPSASPGNRGRALLADKPRRRRGTRRKKAEAPEPVTPSVGFSDRPATSASDRPGTAPERPGTAEERPGTAGSRPGTAGSRPGTAGERPGTAGSRPGTAGSEKRVSFSDRPASRERPSSSGTARKKASAFFGGKLPQSAPDKLPGARRKAGTSFFGSRRSRASSEEGP